MILLLFLILFAAFFVMVRCSFPEVKLPRQPVGLEWRGGVVYDIDRSSHPGTYRREVRWRGPDGEDHLIVYLGNASDARFEVLNGELHVYSDEDLVFEEPPISR